MQSYKRSAEKLRFVVFPLKLKSIADSLVRTLLIIALTIDRLWIPPEFFRISISAPLSSSDELNIVSISCISSIVFRGNLGSKLLSSSLVVFSFFFFE